MATKSIVVMMMMMMMMTNSFIHSSTHLLLRHSLIHPSVITSFTHPLLPSDLTVCNGKSPTNQTPGDHNVPLPSPSMITMDMLLVNMQAMLKMIADKLREKDQQFMEERGWLINIKHNLL